MTRRFRGDTLVLATHNAGKIREMRGILQRFVPHLLTAADLNLPEPPETGVTFLENATLKARAASRRTRHPVLAEDSGLSIKALQGAPGVYSADWAGHPRNFRAAIHRVNAEMGDPSDRSACFTTQLVLVWPDGHTEEAAGQIDGQIVWPPRGSGNFGYDPIFRPTGYAKTFAEMTASEKTEISHRTLAINALIQKCFH